MATNALGALEQALGYKFKKTELIIEALTHRSHHHEFGDSLHNERLEFLGDAVIDLCVTESLMKSGPDMNEGDLSKMRSQLVSESSLAKAALKISLGKAVRLGRGEELSGGRMRESLLADTFEAVLAAIYLDGGLDDARKVLLSVIDGVNSVDQIPWKEATEKLLRRDHKSRLQELCQGAGLGAPAYKCVETRGPDHQRRFVMALYVKDQEIIRAEGPTKKEATQTAARQLLDKATSPESLLTELQDKLTTEKQTHPSRIRQKIAARKKAAVRGKSL